ncbi:MAG: hypothetical protein HQ567_04980 [Candidatus Nealsonbacteria bacterium]|nr:hypothetical protein [Candidatus Nealsonbacteria bacterium]
MFACRCTWVLLAVVVMVVSGCNSGDNTTDADSGDTGKPSADGAKYLLAEEPADAQEVCEVRKTAADGDEVVVVGRIGGEKDPWVEGMAAFRIADTSLKACNEREGDMCTEPWDFCCAPKLADNIMLVKVVDATNKIVSSGAKDLLGVKELQTVVIQGTAERDDVGNVTILAKGIHVRP